MTYAEYYLMELDEAMQGMKRLQTRGDWEIECKCKKERMWSYLAATVAFIVGRSATMSDEALLARIDPYVLSEVTIPRGQWWRAGWFHKSDIELMKPTGPVARYYQWLLGVKRFPVRHGPLNLACGLVPAWITFTGLNHWAQNERLNSYLKQETVFGEMARELVRGKAPEDAIMGVTKRVEKELLR
jgi:hypothetical protein|mmetsp:Transcript_64851/g.108698  ORF Transcript_64851/g.108698 Transcript_64851/m.108698 type:complete len:186 (+) Transcript_64851:50-607(+)|eukprot:CAMPEP_0174284496 /NCGR_PEP_ID=MMETSP0809-20121228/5648_1 /TAXON_ID=73025 ORGANISM="Eutreptiella gymnastica-like, Strain CCMP1594" /NCGR_SAMPLE_ID=MMETSP0809 /ASSEMBLY_ACC=CAM_ASM_000658 /LENGTH=185 /DNA_ID=CAMNT_0015380019 /DNA_START=25 /DNA_END=582 /DNA_ORIENTATION=-